MSKDLPTKIAGESRWTIPGICLFLVIITWAVFGQTLKYDFVNYDDNSYVYENGEIKSGLTFHGIAWAFTHVHSGNWHPLTSIAHMLDWQLFGAKAGGHHFTNVALHTIAVILLFLVLRRMTGSLWRSAFVAAIFAIHPLRAESVAWISERKDVLSGVFFMLTLGAYLHYARRPPSLFRYLLVVFPFALGLMAKPMLVTVPRSSLPLLGLLALSVVSKKPFHGSDRHRRHSVSVPICVIVRRNNCGAETSSSFQRRVAAFMAS